ncbi:MAG: glutamine-hydrolyzing carbamoyl-phosphate synthase small subunit [Methylotenera sp.]|nr:glutamine-hydrolyzing carbamoyl-phosphate synthase small subunit [Oligoflexia bacterium]
MKEIQKVPGVLVLEDRTHPDGKAFPGFLFGSPLSSSQNDLPKDRGYGEVVFNTSMTGYQEILTDPSYYGQIVCLTVPHVGNTGINFEDPESAQPWCAGFVVQESAETPSNWRSVGNLDQYLRTHGIPGLYGVDTRALTRHLRSLGVVRGLILPADQRHLARGRLAELPSFEGRDLIGEVTTQKPYFWPPKDMKSTAAAGGVENFTIPSGGKRYKVVTIDYGVKWNLLKSLHHFGCDIEVLPATSTAAEVLSRKPDGVFLSNGPGDPAAAPYAAEAVRGLVGKVPLFGVCMGHQVLALAMGAKTYKLKFGHRGGNQPVIEHDTKRVEISSHNHGYAVDDSSLPANIEVTHMNLNDRTVEGLRVKGAQAFSVQYHPEACPGPHDSMVLFERFIDSMRDSVKGV